MPVSVLHHTIARFGAGAPNRLLVLHGIFGQGRNWATVANVLVQMRPEWEVALADLREHGKSRGHPPPHTIVACAADVAALAASLGGVTAILGHSFGAKVALSVLATQATALSQAWIVDADPSARDPAGDSWGMLALLRSLPESFATREAFVGAMAGRGVMPAVAGWMATNLEKREGGYALALDLDAMESLLRDYFASDLWGALEPPRTPVHAIRATGSNVLTHAALDRLRDAKGVTVHELTGGHWLNAENASGVAQLLAAQLPS